MRTKSSASRSSTVAPSGDQEEDLVTTEQRKNVTWTDKMDETVIRCLQVQVWEGRKVGNSFKELAYVATAKLVNSTHPQEYKEITKENVVNRFRTIKNTFRNLLFCLKQSGFSFDHVEKKLEVEDSVWYPFAAKRGKEFMKLKNMFWSLFEELKEVVGEDHATGEFSRANKDPLPQPKDKGTTSEEPEPYIPSVDRMEIDETGGNVGSGTQASRAGASHNLPRERKRAKMALSDQISSVATSIDKLADVIQERNQSFFFRKLLAAIKEVDGLSVDIVDIVYMIFS